MNQDQAYFLFLGKSYGRPFNRAEWDRLHSSENSSKEILQKLNLKHWHEFWELCEFSTARFTREDMIRYGKSLGMDGIEVKKEQWDYFIQLPELQNQRIPDSEAILLEFGTWAKFQRVIKTKPSLRKKEEKKLKSIEDLSIQGLIPANIARRISWTKKEVEEHLQNIGLFTQEYVQKNFSSLEEVIGKQIMNIKFYEGEEKNIIREFMIQETAKNLQNNQQLCYCGLPGPNFIDYALFAKTFGILPEQSLVAEYDKVSGYVMHSLIKNWNQIQGGEILRRLKLYLGSIEDALKEKRYKEMRFNLINFDWIGGWAKDKYTALGNLFQHEHLADEALLFITLNNSIFEQGRAASGRGYELNYALGDKYIDIAKKCLEYLGERNKREVTEIFRMPYQDTVEMMTAAYLVRKRKSAKTK